MDTNERRERLTHLREHRSCVVRGWVRNVTKLSGEPFVNVRGQLGREILHGD